MDPGPESALIRKVARQQWKVIAINLGISLIEAFSEGASLAVIFLSIELLAKPEDPPQQRLAPLQT